MALRNVFRLILQMNEIIMIIMALGVFLGGMDRILGNKFGLGEKFEDGFRLMGSIGLSMAGIICLTPLISCLLGQGIAPAFQALGIDPGIFGSILAIDMGGYQLAMDLAVDEQIGAFAGIIVSAIFGCTIVFTIPVGMGAIEEEDRPLFAKGLLMGLIAMPAALLLGGLLGGLSVWQIFWHCSPVLIFEIFLLIGIMRFMDHLVRGFSVFSRFIEMAATLGLTVGAIKYMTGWDFLPTLIPLEDAMEVVCSIAIVMLGSMPMAELVQRILKRPFSWIGKKTGMNLTSTTAILIGAVSVTPALVMMKDMDDRGKTVNAAFLVCAASAFSAHLGFAVSTEPDLVIPLLAAKIAGGVLGIILALWSTRT